MSRLPPGPVSPGPLPVLHGAELALTLETIGWDGKRRHTKLISRFLYCPPETIFKELVQITIIKLASKESET